MIPLVITIKCSLLPRIKAMITLMEIVQRPIRELGGTTPVITLIPMVFTLEQVRLEPKESNGTIGNLV